MDKITSKIIVGDHSAFTDFYTEWDKTIFSFFYNKTKSVEEAKDLTQQTFLSIWKYRETLKESIPIKAQLFQKAKQLYIDWLRKEVVKRSKLIAHAEGQVGPDEHDETSAKLEKIKWATQQLSTKHKKVVLLHYFEGLSYKEISDMLNIPIRTVDSRLYTALKIIKKLS